MDDCVTCSTNRSGAPICNCISNYYENSSNVCT